MDQSDKKESRLYKSVVSGKINDSLASSLDKDFGLDGQVLQTSVDKNYDQIADTIDEVTEKSVTEHSYILMKEIEQKVKVAVSAEVVNEKRLILEQLAPLVVQELNKIDASMQRVKDLIRPHTSINRGSSD